MPLRPLFAEVPLLSEFQEIADPHEGPTFWRTFTCNDEHLRGSYTTCRAERWRLSVHEYTLAHDSLVSLALSPRFGAVWFDSIAGEELTPYRRLRARSLRGFAPDGSEWLGLIHGKTPVRLAALEINPELAREQLGAASSALEEAAEAVNRKDLPELRALLSGIMAPEARAELDEAHGGELADRALGLIAAHAHAFPPETPRTVTPADRERILTVRAYIDDHCTRTLKLADLARIADMSPTKFKECFKATAGVTLTQYLQGRRIAQAETLLRQPDLSIEQVARAVGYTCASRFSELFRRETGLLPSEFRGSEHDVSPRACPATLRSSKRRPPR